MITTAIVSAAMAVTTILTPAVSQETVTATGLVTLKWIDNHSPVGILALPIGPPCYGIQITEDPFIIGHNVNMCVHPDVYKNTYLGTHTTVTGTVADNGGPF